MNYGIVYHIFNVNTGKSYVGQTVQTIEQRWKEHLGYARDSVKPLYQSMRKHGLDSFVLTKLVEVSDQEELNYAELYFGEFFKALYPNGYCLKLGEGRGRHCQETKEKIRSKRKEQNEKTGKNSPREGTGRVNIFSGICPCGTEFTRKKKERKYCSSKCYGLFDHDRLAKNFSAAGSKAVSKKIRSLETGKIYESARQACRELEIPWGSFRKILLKGERLRYVQE